MQGYVGMTKKLNPETVYKFRDVPTLNDLLHILNTLRQEEGNMGFSDSFGEKELSLCLFKDEGMPFIIFTDDPENLYITMENGKIDD